MTWEEDATLTELQREAMGILTIRGLGQRGMSKWEMADALGTTTQGAYRVLSNLQAKGYLHPPGVGYQAKWWPKT